MSLELAQKRLLDWPNYKEPKRLVLILEQILISLYDANVRNDFVEELKDLIFVARKSPVRFVRHEDMIYCSDDYVCVRIRVGYVVYALEKAKLYIRS